MTQEKLKELFLSDIAAIRTEQALKTWGKRWAPEIKRSGYVDEIRSAYNDKMDKLTTTKKCKQPSGTQ